ncbi:MAG: NUDIX domain-containing protein [Dysgonamonadaceae bacterium]|jgi:ADP-ribose pyrophosphatase YjhB (NUDIX family)|nr:NUDIX domain-containing protein [Dysgonamonadaceae bacterium]
MENTFIRTCVSVDCVVFGFDKSQLNVLLVQRNAMSSSGKELKLPGSLIYQQEDADTGAYRVLNELTGIKKIALRQFKSFTSPKRISDSDDVAWLEATYHNKIDRLITIAYLSLGKIDRKLHIGPKYTTATWCPVSQLPRMPFDHNQIVEEALNEIRRWVEAEPVVLFELLPVKFTAAELRRLYEAIYHRKYDIRNFHKQILRMEYVLPMEEKQEHVAHRAARYYKFDRIIYNKRKI